MLRAVIAAVVLLLVPATAGADEVRITEEMLSVTVETREGPFEIRRNQDLNASILPAFSKVARKCPPFCIQPMEAAPGVKPVGELEVIEALKSRNATLIDARTTDWHLKGTIPGSVNIPYTEVVKRMGELGCKGADCSGAQTIILYCNGIWCGQSPTAIKELLGAGFPASKILYYRGGIQSWLSVGLPLVEGSL